MPEKRSALPGAVVGSESGSASPTEGGAERSTAEHSESGTRARSVLSSPLPHRVPGFRERDAVGSCHLEEISETSSGCLRSLGHETPAKRPSAVATEQTEADRSSAHTCELSEPAAESGFTSRSQAASSGATDAWHERRQSSSDGGVTSGLFPSGSTTEGLDHRVYVEGALLGTRYRVVDGSGRSELTELISIHEKVRLVGLDMDWLNLTGNKERRHRKITESLLTMSEQLSLRIQLQVLKLNVGLYASLQVATDIEFTFTFRAEDDG